MNEPVQTTVLELVDGVKVVVPDSLEVITTYVLQEQGDWFEDEIRFLRHLVQPGQTVVDIGANLGVYTLSMARRVGPQGRVWAFEPACRTAELLAHSIRSNGFTQVRLEQKALSNRSGSGLLLLQSQPELHALAASDLAERHDEGASEVVELTSLDEFFDGHGWPAVDIVKMDAEGEEARIIEGGERFLRAQSPLVLLEIKAGADLHLELVDQLTALGYKPFRLVPGLNLLAPFDPETPPDGYLLNLFACKEDRAGFLERQGFLVPMEGAGPRENAVAPYGWRLQIANLPYGRYLQEAWEFMELCGLQPVVGEGLALFALSQDSNQENSLRLAALQRSFNLLRELCTEDAPLLRRSSLARVALALGERCCAMDALGQLLRCLEKEREVDLSEPFLPACDRYDTVDPGDRVMEWIAAAALEALERHGAFSGFYTGLSAVQRLEVLRSLGFGEAFCCRRLALLQRRFGMAFDQRSGREPP